MSEKGQPSTLSSKSFAPTSNQLEYSVYDSAEHEKWVWAWMATTGIRHLPNGVCEDAAGVKIRQDGGINAVMADGVSRGAFGEIAAQTLVKHCLGWIPEKYPDLQMWFSQETERVVHDALIAVTSEAGACTSASVWIMPDGRAWFTRVGDCRGYTWHDHENHEEMPLTPLLFDQTLSYMGYSSPYSPLSKSPAHMVGNGNMGELEWKLLQVSQNTGVVLCSDGLYEFVNDTDWANILNDLSITNEGENDKALLRACQQLITLAKKRGSQDDVSVLLLWRKN